MKEQQIQFDRMHVRMRFSLIGIVLLYAVLIWSLSYFASMGQSTVNIFGLVVSATAINGLLMQAQILLIIYLVGCQYRWGYEVALALTAVNFLGALIQVCVLSKMEAIPGVFMPVVILLILWILHRYEKRISEIADRLYSQNHTLRQSHERLHQLAYFDVLTGLPNRKMLIDRLELLTQLATKDKLDSFALVFIDLDNFKRINDTLGHDAGDAFLCMATSVLEKNVAKEDLLGRLGGDEFALLIQRKLPDQEILKYVEELRERLLQPFELKEKELSISASFGIAVFPTDSTDLHELLKFADTAMYEAKNSGKNRVYFFNKIVYQDMLRRMEFENDLKMAVEQQELFLVFQPQYEVEQRRLRGVEALLRWRSKRWGVVMPKEFIPIAEDTGFIVYLGEWVLEEACQTFSTIQKAYDVPLLLTVNISAVQIKDPLFLGMVRRVLQKTKMDGSQLEFEVTESIFIDSMDYVVRVIHELQNMGIHIALDDFGTGYSSLNYLQNLPLNTLKIDKSFIGKIGESDRQEAVIQSLISLAHHMHLLVVAEGVEKENQAACLRESGCDYIQGFLWGKPLEEEALHALLRHERDKQVYQ